MSNCGSCAYWTKTNKCNTVKWGLCSAPAPIMMEDINRITFPSFGDGCRCYVEAKFVENDEIIPLTLEEGNG